MSLMTLPDVVRCYRTSRALQRYLDGEADDRTATRIAEHLEECRRCGLNAATYRAIKQVIHAGQRRRRTRPATAPVVQPVPGRDRGSIRSSLRPGAARMLASPTGPPEFMLNGC